MKLFVRLQAPFEWVRVTGRTVAAFGEVASPHDYPLDEEEEIVGVVGGGWITVHQVELPAKTKRQFMTALPYALEDAVSEELDDLHFVCPEWQAGSANRVYVVSRAMMREWQELANTCKLPLDRLVPDYSLLPLHEVADATLCRMNSLGEDGQEQIICHQRNGSGLTLDKEFLDIWMAEIPMNQTVAVTDRELAETLIEQYADRDFRLWEVGNRMAHWLEHPVESSSLDLMGDQFRPSVRSLEWRRYRLPAALIAASLALFLLFDVYRYFALHQEIQASLEQQEAVLVSTFPEISNVPEGSARLLMERALRNQVGEAPRHNATSMIAVTAQVLRQQRVSLSEIQFRDGKLSITCILNDLSQVDQITRSLNSRSKISAQLESSANDDGQIFASYILEVQS